MCMISMYTLIRAGIQADLHAIKAMGGHGCSAIAALTAQNSIGVTAVHAPPIDFLRAQLDALVSDLFPRGIKIGMLATKEVANLVGEVLKEIKEASNGSRVWVVLDPVMISTSGSKLIDDDAVDAIVKNVFPYADVVTPNKFEAEALLGRKLKTPEDVQKGAQDLLAMGCKGVLIKGGHTLIDENDATSELKATITYAQDYLLTNEELPKEEDRRLCDSASGIWLRTKRWDTDNTHGTGCTLSSAFAAALAIGEAKRQDESSKEGATSSIFLSDACCLAKAYVSAGIQQGVQLGAGPGPVVQTSFPSSYEHFPSIISEPTSDLPAFPPMKAYSADKSDDGIPVLGRILPIVDTVDWIRKLAETPGVEDIQLRIKGETDADKIAERVQACQEICSKEGVRLWINDYWEAAVQAGCFGVHVGQEDLLKCKNAGGLEKLREKGMALGISTHSYGELAAAIGIKPSYISLGPIFATSSKKVGFDPQGLGILSKWRDLIPPSIPFVTIGGINTIETAKSNKQAGSDCIAVIGAVTKAENLPLRIQQLNEAML
ncbi:MAG: hypothetical protein SGBAC_004604 [Bacillariaceae sp.]